MFDFFTWLRKVNLPRPSQLFTQRAFEPAPQVQLRFTRVLESEYMRPDLISERLYDSNDYIDVLCKINNVYNPLFFVPGDLLYFPAKEDIESYFPTLDNVRSQAPASDSPTGGGGGVDFTPHRDPARSAYLAQTPQVSTPRPPAESEPPQVRLEENLIRLAPKK